MFRRSHLLYLFAIACVLLVPLVRGQVSDLEKNLLDRYKGKTFLLRGFYSDEKLRYDQAGNVVGPVKSGDWTVDGVVKINEIHTSSQVLTIGLRRLIVAGPSPLRIVPDAPMKGEKDTPSLEIEVDLGSDDVSELKVDAALAEIFLSPEDDFSALVPNYWKPCVRLGLTEHDGNCELAREFLHIPGALPKRKNKSVDETDTERNVFRIGGGVSPPKVISQSAAQFSEPARKDRFQGVVLVGLVVDEQGLPTHIHILRPLGYGLDAKAVQAVESWRFHPAEKKGQPVAVAIDVEVDFHLK